MYRKQTKYSSCQLIAAINARIFLGGNDIADEEYESLVDLVKCRYGGAICIEKAYPVLGLETVDGPVDPIELKWIKEHLPVDISIHDPKLGYHSTLIIGICGDKIMLNNAFYEEISWNDLEKLFPVWDYQRRCRSFRIRR